MSMSVMLTSACALRKSQIWCGNATHNRNLYNRWNNFTLKNVCSSVLLVGYSYDLWTCHLETATWWDYLTEGKVTRLPIGSVGIHLTFGEMKVLS
jgi:hypothetical protein